MKPLRICLIGPTYPYRGGIAHYTTLLAQHLRHETDHELLLISFSEQYPGWLYKGRSDRDPSEFPLQTDAEYLLAPLNPITWWRVYRRIRDWRADLVILQWWVPFWAPVWITLTRVLRRLSRSPRLVFICHNVLPHEMSRVGEVIVPWLGRLTLGVADGYVLHSQSDAEDLTRLLPGARYQVGFHPSLASLGAKAAAALPVAIPEDRPLLLFAGFIRPYKGLDILLRALPTVLARREVHLLVAGEFWEKRETYNALIAQLGIEEAVTIIDDYVPDEVLTACVRRADVVVLPYRDATQSAVIQFAFGHEKPVITTNVGGLAKAVAHGETGLVVPPDDPAALAAAINIFFDENLGDRLVGNIRARQEQFSWQRLVEAILVVSMNQEDA